MQYDQSFNSETLLKALRKSDFYNDRNLHLEHYKNALIESAITSAHTNFNATYPLNSFTLNQKNIYQFIKLKDELVARKICRNLQYAAKVTQQSREFIVSNLASFLREGVPYRLYRLDVKSFYESFSIDQVKTKIETIPRLSPSSKFLICELMDTYKAAGGRGIPRGLALSAVMSELMMADFDANLFAQIPVYFSARYVDDITIVTNAEECPRQFMKILNQLLPDGLAFSDTKKDILTAKDVVAPAALKNQLLSFSYLGYRFTVSDPIQNKKIRPNKQFRDVSIDIAPQKINRLKTRIVRSFLSYGKDKNFQLLTDRIKYLASNFSVKDLNKNKYMLAGIYYSYPQITPDTALGLQDLDVFLRNAIRSNATRTFTKSHPFLTNHQRRTLLKIAFSRGHSQRTFLHFPAKKIRLIEECWKHG